VVAVAGTAVAGGDFGLPVAELGRAELLLLLTVAMGLSLGLALMNSALAIALALAASTLMAALGSVWPGVDEVVAWIDPTTFAETLSEDRIGGGDWARMATTAGLWIALPAAVGLVRLPRSEVK
jgi:ABC-2 type transport system permease protein